MRLNCKLSVGSIGLIELRNCENSTRFFTFSLYEGVDSSGRPIKSDFVTMNKEECTNLLEMIRMVSGCDLPASWGLNGSSL